MRLPVATVGLKSLRIFTTRPDVNDIFTSTGEKIFSGQAQMTHTIIGKT
jgi:hypothetical protein